MKHIDNNCLVTKDFLEEEKKLKKSKKNFDSIKKHISKKVPKLLKRKAKFYRTIFIHIDFYPNAPTKYYREGFQAGYMLNNQNIINQYIDRPHNIHYYNIATGYSTNMVIIEKSIINSDNGKIDFSLLDRKIEYFINGIPDIPKKN